MSDFSHEAADARAAREEVGRKVGETMDKRAKERERAFDEAARRKPAELTTEKSLNAGVDVPPGDVEKAPMPAPQLRAIRFREPVTLDGLTPLTRIDLTDPKARHEALVVGASVFVRVGGIVAEVPRAACLLYWSVPGGTLADAVRALTGKGK